MDVPKILGCYTFWGIEFVEQSGEEYIGYCYFCKHHKPKFYVNGNTGAFDCKTCNSSGSWRDFLKATHEHFLRKTSEDELLYMTKMEGIPLPALQNARVAKKEIKYFVPYYNTNYEVCDLRLWRYKRKEYSTRNGNKGLFNLNNLRNFPKTKQHHIYICEGFRDAIALQWLFWRNKQQAYNLVLATGGKNTFDDTWPALFEDRNVVLSFDHLDGYGTINKDTGKATGTKKWWLLLRDITQSIQYIQWPESKVKGFDPKDFINEWKNKPREALERFKTYRNQFESNRGLGQTVEAGSSKNKCSTVSYKDVFRDCSEIYEINRAFERGIKIALATCISHFLPGKNNVWMFLTGPSGCGKTEICELFMEAKKNVLWQSTLSSKALISGLGIGKSLLDPSILARVDKKCLIVNDFTTVLGNHHEREDIFNILRDAYLGFVRRPFGNGERIYKSKFSCLCGVTPIIQQFNNTSLGERFLRYNLPQQEGLEEKALEIEMFGGEKKDRLKDLVNNFLQQDWQHEPEVLAAKIPRWFKDRLPPLAKLCASMRTSVVRHEKGLRYGGLVYKPVKETGARIATQLQKLALGLCLLEEKPFVDEEIYAICRQIAIDTISSFEYSIVKFLVNRGNKWSIKDLQEATKVDQIGFFLKDLELLNIIQRNGTSPPVYYASQLTRDLFKRSCL